MLKHNDKKHGDLRIKSQNNANLLKMLKQNDEKHGDLHIENIRTTHEAMVLRQTSSAAAAHPVHSSKCP